MPRQPRSVHTPADQPVMLELPSGDRYHLHPRQADLEGYLAPDRVPHVKPGIAPIKVQVAHGEAGYLVSLAPDELETLLRRARLEVEALAERPPRPAASHDPARGQGQRDPQARRLGPNADRSPDPGHRGPTRRRRKPQQ
jgi:hypothetical protein